MAIDRGQVFVLLILVGLVAAFVGGLWWPRTHRVTETLRLIDAREATLAGLREETASDVATSIDPADPADAALARAELAAALPSRPDLGPLLERLSADLQRESLTVQQLQARTPVEGATFDRIPVTLQCTGTWSALFALFRRIEAYDRIVRVDRIGITGDAGADPGGALVADIELSTFRRVVPEDES